MPPDATGAEFCGEEVYTSAAKLSGVHRLSY